MNSVDRSGFNEEMKMDAAVDMFETSLGHKFKFFGAWRILKELPKYRSHGELPRLPEPAFESEEGDPLNDGMVRPTGTKKSRQLQGDLTLKAAERKLLEESNKVLVELGKERVAQAYAFQDEMVT